MSCADPVEYDRNLYVASDFKICFRMKDSNDAVIDPNDFHITFRAATGPGEAIIFDFSTETGSNITVDSDGIVTVKISSEDSMDATFTTDDIYYEIDTVNKLSGEDIRRLRGHITINKTVEL